MTHGQSTYDRALTLLGFRARSVQELRRKLLQKGEPAADVEGVIARLCDQKLLDDADFARQFARTKLLGAGASRLRIAQELARKGVARPIADAAIAALEEDEGLDLSASVHRVAEKKWKSMGALDDITRKRRLYAFLARRGFNPDEIRDAPAALTR
jgi:regulatory protein